MREEETSWEPLAGLWSLLWVSWEPLQRSHSRVGTGCCVKRSQRDKGGAWTSLGGTESSSVVGMAWTRGTGGEVVGFLHAVIPTL
jgi:hypothetical protein